jgi:hypothetical protein
MFSFAMKTVHGSEMVHESLLKEVLRAVCAPLQPRYCGGSAIGLSVTHRANGQDGDVGTRLL